MLFYLKSIKNFGTYLKSINIWGYTAVFIVSFVDLTRPASFIPVQIAIVIVYIFIICLVIPNRLFYQVISSVILAISVVSTAVINGSGLSLTALFSLVVAFCVAVSISWQFDVYRGRTFQEITKREKIEEELKESEKLYRTIFDNSEDGFMLLEPIFDSGDRGSDFRFIKINKAYEQQTGAKVADVLGKLASETVPEMKLEIAQLSGEVAKSGKSIHIESYNNYSKRWYDSYYFPYTESQVGILFRNITERKEVQESLEKSEEQYRQLFNSMTEMFFVADLLYDNSGKVLDFVYTEANPAFINSIGKPTEEVVGRRAKELFGGVGIEDFWLEELGKIKKTGISIHDEQSSRRTGKCYDVSVWRISENRVGVIFEDITGRKALEKQAQDNERMAAIGQTAGMVGHDLRNPLQSIIGEVYLAESELKSFPDNDQKESLKESIKAIGEQISYMDKIVSDLQTFVKPVEVHKENVNLHQLVIAVLEQTKTPNILVKMSVEDGTIIKADPQLLKRVLINLFTNSIQAMPNGGTLTLKSQAIGRKSLQIIIEDTGIGIPDSIKPKIFAPLFTTKAKGQGFGLAVCKRVIEAQGGNIFFESQEGKGTKFTVELPTL